MNPNRIDFDDNEVKFTIGNHRRHQLLAWLASNCKPDPAFPAEIVSSIYFDTWNWDALREKINSDYLKTKIRVRWYADIENRHQGPPSFVEAKYKIGSKRKKIRVKAPYDGKWLADVRLENPALQHLLQLLRSEGVAIPRPCFPAYHIQYKRYRYLDPSGSARLCFDCDIAVPRINRFMLCKQNAFALNTAVFEIKGRTRDVPFSLYPLLRLGLKKASFSKYGACYQKMTQTP